MGAMVPPQWAANGSLAVTVLCKFHSGMRSGRLIGHQEAAQEDAQAQAQEDAEEDPLAASRLERLQPADPR
jgi:hypothetical protein